MMTDDGDDVLVPETAFCHLRLYYYFFIPEGYLTSAPLAMSTLLRGQLQRGAEPPQQFEHRVWKAVVDVPCNLQRVVIILPIIPHLVQRVVGRH